MSDETEKVKDEEVKIVEETENEEVEAAEDPAEAEARRMGWVPQDEFRGNKDYWKDANKFVEAGKNELPILKERYKDLDKRYAKLDRIVKDLPGKMAKIEKQTIERVTKELKTKQREAFDNGDLEAFEAADKELEELQKNVEEKTEDKPQEVQPIIDDWADKNDWYRTDEDLASYASGLHGRTWDRNPDSLASNLEMVAKKTREMFPTKFENPNRNKPAAVEGGGATIKTKSGQSYGDLPPEARAVCDELVADKVLTKKQYIKDYFAGEKS